MHVGKQSSVMLASKRLAGVALEMNLREHISHTPLPSVNKAAHSGFETRRRCHQKSEIEARYWHFEFELVRRTPRPPAENENLGRSWQFEHELVRRVPSPHPKFGQILAL